MVSHMTPSEYGLVKALYGVNETMALLSIGRTSLYELVKRGELKPAKLGKKTLFYASDLAALLAKLRQPKAVPQLQGTSEVHVSRERAGQPALIAAEEPRKNPRPRDRGFSSPNTNMTGGHPQKQDPEREAEAAAKRIGSEE